MLTILNAVVPVFALIAAGFGFGRFRKVGPDGIAILNGFTVWLALPALLFKSLAEGDWAALDQPGFLLAFGGGMIVTFLIGLALKPPAGSREPLADRALTALTGAYANTGFIGIPLGQGLLGAVGLTAGVISSILTISALFAVALLLVEVGLAGQGGLGQSARKVGRALLRNPLVVSPIAGILWALGGWPMPAMADRFLTLLSAAASPCALVTIGAFLALPQRAGATTALPAVLGLKLIAQPALTAAAALWLAPALGIHLTREWTTAAILFAVLPTGTGPFMLAELYGREAALASRAILISTVLGTALITILAFAIT